MPPAPPVYRQSSSYGVIENYPGQTAPLFLRNGGPVKGVPTVRPQGEGVAEIDLGNGQPVLWAQDGQPLNLLPPVGSAMIGATGTAGQGRSFPTMYPNGRPGSKPDPRPPNWSGGLLPASGSDALPKPKNPIQSRREGSPNQVIGPPLRDGSAQLPPVPGPSEMFANTDTKVAAFIPVGGLGGIGSGALNLGKGALSWLTGAGTTAAKAAAPVARAALPVAGAAAGGYAGYKGGEVYGQSLAREVDRAAQQGVPTWQAAINPASYIYAATPANLYAAASRAKPEFVPPMPGTPEGSAPPSKPAAAGSGVPAAMQGLRVEYGPGYNRVPDLAAPPFGVTLPSDSPLPAKLQQRLDAMTDGTARPSKLDMTMTTDPKTGKMAPIDPSNPRDLKGWQAQQADYIQSLLGSYQQNMPANSTGARSLPGPSATNTPTQSTRPAAQGQGGVAAGAEMPMAPSFTSAAPTSGTTRREAAFRELQRQLAAVDPEQEWAKAARNGLLWKPDKKSQTAYSRGRFSSTFTDGGFAPTGYDPMAVSAAKQKAVTDRSDYAFLGEEQRAAARDIENAMKAKISAATTPEIAALRAAFETGVNPDDPAFAQLRNDALRSVRASNKAAGSADEASRYARQTAFRTGASAPPIAFDYGGVPQLQALIESSASEFGTLVDKAYDPGATPEQKAEAMAAMDQLIQGLQAQAFSDDATVGGLTREQLGTMAIEQFRNSGWTGTGAWSPRSGPRQAWDQKGWLNDPRQESMLGYKPSGWTLRAEMIRRLGDSKVPSYLER